MLVISSEYVISVGDQIHSKGRNMDEGKNKYFNRYLANVYARVGGLVDQAS
jgi:hypothetical protein